MPFLGSAEGKIAFGRPSAPKGSVGGSLFFDGSANSNLSIPNDIDFRNGTGDFTIEWFQYATMVGNSFPRIFSIGSYAAQSIAVSQEGPDASRTFYAWISGANAIESNQNYSNTWVYFALCRSGTNFRVFKNGTQIGTTITNSTNFNDTTNAKKYYLESIRIKPDYFDAYYSLGVLYYSIAFGIYEEIKKLPNTDQKNYDRLIPIRNKYFELAIPYMEKANTILPEDRDTLIALKQLYITYRRFMCLTI